MVLLDQMIKTGRLYEFIGEVINIYNEDQEEKALWEFWLHKDFERSYLEFLNDTQSNTAEPEQVSEADLTEIVKQSMKIASFVPQEK